MDLLRCLWLAREVPFPANTGDRIYSGCLAQALAAAGVEVSYLGLGSANEIVAPAMENFHWISVKGRKKANWQALFSRFPLVTEAHNTAQMRRVLREQLTKDWDAIILDHYGTGWMLDAVTQYIKKANRRIFVAHVSHNFEEKLALSLFFANWGRPLRSLVLFQNFLKIMFWERRIARSVDLCTSITSEDLRHFAANAPHTRMLTLTPGYSGKIIPERIIGDQTPRRVVLIGSYRWGVKELNLRKLLDAADGPFSQAGISLDVIGDVPDTLLQDYKQKLKSCNLHGFVADYAPYLDDARMALVPEVVGGGFKLKFLDYIFGGMPVATISEASAGLPEDIRENFLHASDMNDLVRKVIETIDDLPVLNRMSSRAYSSAKEQFDWSDRGVLLKDNLFGSNLVTQR